MRCPECQSSDVRVAWFTQEQAQHHCTACEWAWLVEISAEPVRATDAH